MNKKIIFILIIGILILAGIWYVYSQQPQFFGKPVAVQPKDEWQAISESGNIKIKSPKPSAEVGLPLTFSGEARVFENVFNYELRDGQNNILAQGIGYANSPDIGQFGVFEISFNYTEPKTESGTLEVFDYSAKDGEKIDVVFIPVKFAKVEAMNVKIFFGNSKLDPNVMDCSKVFSVDRRIAKTSGVAKASIEELLLGLTAKEVEAGYFTNINMGTKIQSISLDDGVLKIDFNDMLEVGIGGSCKVASIRSQIIETLKQFSSVKDVIISINGRTEDILQP